MRCGTFHLDGFSLGGIETAVSIPEWRLAIDVGRGRADLLRAQHLALTHTHMDHAGGLPYLLGLRQLYRMPPVTVYVPARLAGALQAMLDAWARLQRFDFAYTLVAVEPGARYPLARDLELVPFRTRHVIPSVGYQVVRTTHKLLPELHGRPGPELGALRAKGVEITSPHRATLLAVTGDTLPEVLDDHPELSEAEVLVLECTFLDDRKPYEACRAGGHVHLRDLLERAERLTNPTVVLSHFSQIYQEAELPSLLAPLAARLPGELRTLPVEPGGEVSAPITPEASAP